MKSNGNNIILEKTSFLQSANSTFIREIYLKSLNEKRKIDFYRGLTSIGPHKTDLEVIYREKEMTASLCSTGEQKSLLISIILSVAKSYKKHTNLSPILLLDEVFSHLDNDKKQSLSREIESLDSQAFMTGIDKSDFMTFNKDSCIINLDSN